MSTARKHVPKPINPFELIGIKDLLKDSLLENFTLGLPSSFEEKLDLEDEVIEEMMEHELEQFDLVEGECIKLWLEMGCWYKKVFCLMRSIRSTPSKSELSE
uniref:Uncharacterized protein n=1 Tax=Glossina pallidipes TaxID=7398 RepID=A0A1A9ZXP0_GLOPL